MFPGFNFNFDKVFKDIRDKAVAKTKPVPHPPGSPPPGVTPLFNRDYILPFGLPASEGTKRQNEAVESLMREYYLAVQKDKEDFNKTLTPDKIIDGIKPPVPLQASVNVAKRQIDEAKALLQVTFKTWLDQFRANAEVEGGNLEALKPATGMLDIPQLMATSQKNYDFHMARLKTLEPFANLVTAYLNRLAKEHGQVVEAFEKERAAYTEKLNEKESQRLLKEAEKARIVAEELMATKEVLEKQGKSAQSNVVESQAIQLNKIADKKEAIAESKAPKSNTGLVLALAAGAALLLASQQ
jgi:hypothetical protein